MVKSEIIKQLHKKHPVLNLHQIETIVDIMFSSIIDSLIKQQSVELMNFGRFSIKTSKAKYNAKNPKTAELIYVPVIQQVSFKMAKHLNEQLSKQ